MPALRSFFRNHRRLAIWLIVVALAIKALVPAGYMLGTKSHVLTVQICAETQGRQLSRTVTIPGKSEALAHAKSDGVCGWQALAMTALGGVDLALLALALAFILLLGTAPSRPGLARRRTLFRPPLRGPPAAA